MSKVRSEKESAVTYEMARNLFSYDATTGELTILTGQRAGKIVTKKDRVGYLRVLIDGRYFQVHRVAWLLAYGEWPIALVDHRDRNPSNNALENLRSATPQQNMANMRLRRRNKTGFKGVTITKYGKFRAAVIYNRKTVHLGTFLTKELAGEAYADAAKRLFGEFARQS